MDEAATAAPGETGSGVAADQDIDGRLRHTWVSDALFAETQHVWSRAYGREITDGEVIEILTNVRRLTETFFNATREDENECSRLGTRLIA